MEMILDFSVGVVVITALTYLPWLIGDSIATGEENHEGFDKWRLGMLVMFYTVSTILMVNYVG